MLRYLIKLLVPYAAYNLLFLVLPILELSFGRMILVGGKINSVAEPDCRDFVVLSSTLFFRGVKPNGASTLACGVGKSESLRLSFTLFFSSRERSVGKPDSSGVKFVVGGSTLFDRSFMPRIPVVRFI